MPADDFFRLIGAGAFEDIRAELVDGRIGTMSPAYGNHSTYNPKLVVALARAIADPVVIGTDLAIWIDAHTMRGADIALGREAFPPDRAAFGKDLLLLLEVAGTTQDRDLTRKPKDYARAGVETYWVVDLVARAVDVMTGASEPGYARREIVPFGKPLAVPGTDATIVID